MHETYEFDDVLIPPIPSDVNSRDDVDISVKLGKGLTLKFPLIASPMVGVTDGNFAHLLSFLGGMAILHRFYKSRESFLDDIKQNIREGDKFGISIKVGENIDGAWFYKNPSVILVDTANGYTKKYLDYCEYVKTNLSLNGSSSLLMGGNVATAEGVISLTNVGCDIIRVGIGGGSPCSTRNQTGVGVPSISMLREIANNYDGSAKIIMDGGIKNSGDFVKAIVAGADAAMAGRLFAECFEAPNEGVLYGMASRTHMENTKLPVKSVEGIDVPIKKKQSLYDFVREFGYGIKSAGTYLNARSLEDMFYNGNFIKVTDSAIKKGI